ncbi:hypothetical protein INR49_000928 [Scomber scombrus]|uniref:PiggyBac transposable element-derived protein domain-containing protein n=1 Tax=Scomber scombrus TaxID=13677 RepID=A0AAV1PGN8_SCOSC
MRNGCQYRQVQGSSSDSEGEESGNVAEGVEAEEGVEAIKPEEPPPLRAQGEKAKENMHFVDNYSLDPENDDRFAKVRPVLDALKKTFRSTLDPEEFRSVDEMMIPYKGRLTINQYMYPKNPSPGE